MLTEKASYVVRDDKRERQHGLSGAQLQARDVSSDEALCANRGRSATVCLQPQLRQSSPGPELQPRDAGTHGRQ